MWLDCIIARLRTHIDAVLSDKYITWAPARPFTRHFNDRYWKAIWKCKFGLRKVIRIVGPTTTVFPPKILCRFVVLLHNFILIVYSFALQSFLNMLTTREYNLKITQVKKLHLRCFANIRGLALPVRQNAFPLAFHPGLCCGAHHTSPDVLIGSWEGKTFRESQSMPLVTPRLTARVHSHLYTLLPMPSGCAPIRICLFNNSMLTCTPLRHSVHIRDRRCPATSRTCSCRDPTAAAYRVWSQVQGCELEHCSLHCRLQRRSSVQECCNQPHRAPGRKNNPIWFINSIR